MKAEGGGMKDQGCCGVRPRAALPLAKALQSIAGNYQRVLGLNEVFDVTLPGWAKYAKFYFCLW